MRSRDGEYLSELDIMIPLPPLLHEVEGRVKGLLNGKRRIA